MTDKHDSRNPPYGRLIREAKEEAFHARRKLRREQPNPTPETKQDVAAALADYHDVLQDYADERTLKTPWDERLPVKMDSLLDETVPVQQSVPSRNPNAREAASMPAVVRLTPHELLTLAKELDKIAKELGFAAEAKTSREQFHIASPDSQDHPEPVNDNVQKPGEPVR